MFHGTSPLRSVQRDLYNEGISLGEKSFTAPGNAKLQTNSVAMGQESLEHGDS